MWICYCGSSAHSHCADGKVWDLIIDCRRGDIQKSICVERLTASIVLYHLCLSLLSTFSPCPASEFLAKESSMIPVFCSVAIKLQTRMPSEHGNFWVYSQLFILLAETFYSVITLYPLLGNHPSKRCHQLSLRLFSQPLTPLSPSLPPSFSIPPSPLLALSFCSQQPRRNLIIPEVFSSIFRCEWG